MNYRRLHLSIVSVALTLLATFCFTTGFAAEGYTKIGTIIPRAASEIESSNWSVGAETMDRDFTIYRHWKKYLGPLGVKRARIQSGWAKTEKIKGKYDWKWLDEIILDMVDQGVEPWVCLCYGNPIYEGGGGTGLGGGMPTSPEALAAWDRFVDAFVQRYKDQVDEWEIWNEPGLRGANPEDAYADFLIRSAEIIRRHQPDATIIGFAMAGVKHSMCESVLGRMKKAGKLDLIDQVSYHPYTYNPDDSYSGVLKLRRIVESFSSDIIIMQGENGCPSKRGSFGAISGNDWTESSQAKWALRRLLGDLGRDIPSSYFAICDMEYTSRRNTKGLLAINDDQTVHHAKEGYRAVQHLTALFDNRITRVKNFSAEITKASGEKAESSHSVFGYQTRASQPVVTIWRSSDTPGKDPKHRPMRIHIATMTFDTPVLIDLRTGRVDAIDGSLVKEESGATTFLNLPIYDSPIVLAERGWLEDEGRLRTP